MLILAQSWIDSNSYNELRSLDVSKTMTLK